MSYTVPNDLVSQYNAGQRQADPSKIDENFDYVTTAMDAMAANIADLPAVTHTEMDLRGLWSASVRLTTPVSWTDQKTPGNYYVPANSGNTGGPTTDAYHLQVMPMDANNVAQIAWPSYVGGMPMYRTEVGGSWQPWNNMVNATSTPTAHAVPQADEDGDVWGLAKSDMSNLNATGKAAITSKASPSNRYIDISLPSPGGTYTAPANGWLTFVGTADLAGKYLQLVCGKRNTIMRAYAPGNAMSAWMKVQKNQVVTVYYDFSGYSLLTFTYDEGN